LLFVLLVRRGYYRPRPGWVRFLLTVLVATLAMGIVLWLLKGENRSWVHLNNLTRVAWLLGLTLTGALTYFGLLASTGWRPRDFLRKET
jgi:putative peptidoglycan lipid II flippase